MRALLTDPSALDHRAYRRFVQRSQLRGLLADHLVDGEPYLALNALVLDAAESQLLQALTRAFSSAFQRAAGELAREVPTLVEMGFPWVAAELLAAEPPWVPLVGRFDFARDEAGHWWLLEFNADTPSGVREAIVVDQLAHRAIPEASRLQRPSAGLGDAIARAFCVALHDLPRGATLGLVTDAGELEDLAQMAFTQRLIRPPLARHGIDVLLGDANNLRATRRGLSLGDRPIDALYRYMPFESMLGTPAFAAIYDALSAGRLRLLNGLFGLLQQHKGLLAWLWRHRADRIFDAPGRAAIQQHLPPSWMVGEVPPDLPQGTLVAKQVFGREGEEVFFGEDLSPEDWQTLRQRRTYIAQQRIRVGELDAVVPTSAGPQVWRGQASVGCYTVLGRWAGYYTRFGQKIITSRAKWVATFVE